MQNDLAWEHSQHHYCGMNFEPGLTKKCSECYKVNKERQARVDERNAKYVIPEAPYSPEQYKIYAE